MAKYETMLVTSSNLDEEASSALIAKFKTLIEANGTMMAFLITSKSTLKRAAKVTIPMGMG